jgi:hypothetical protein
MNASDLSLDPQIENISEYSLSSSFSPGILLYLEVKQPSLVKSHSNAL